MVEFDPFNDDDGTVFRDVIMLALAGFVAMVLLLLPHLNPPGEAAEEDVRAPGTVIVEIFWPDDLNVDVDLWTHAPGELRPVGYSNRSGRYLNLLRDDLGHLVDESERNFEVVYSRGCPSGEWTVNVHLYNNRAGVWPIPVRALVSVKPAGGKRSAKQILTADVELHRRGEELTVFRFRFDDGCSLVPGSVHDLLRPLRSARSFAS